MTLRRALPPFVALVLLAALAIVLLPRGDSTSPPLSGREANSGGPVAPVVQPSTSGRKGVERLPLESEPAPLPMLRILVLREGSRVPVAGCRVSMADLDQVFETFKAQASAPGQRVRRELFLELAASGLTGEDGEVLLPFVGDRQLIAAKGEDGLWGRRIWTGSPAGPVEVIVGEDGELRAVVRSAASGPPVAGIPVVLCGGPPRTTEYTELSATDGSAVFLHVQRMLTSDASWNLSLGFPVCDHRRVPIRPNEFEMEPVELVLPPTGSLELQIRDEAGRPVPGTEVSVEITAFTSPARTIELPCQGSSRKLEFDIHGKAELDYLGLDLPLRIEVSAGDSESTRLVRSTDVDGPRRAGETVECSLSWPSELAFPTVTGRFVREDGSPWPEARVRVQSVLFPAPHRTIPPKEIEVTEDGRFRLLLLEPHPPGGSRLIHLIALAPDALKGVEGRLDLSRTLPAGETEVGDVLLDRGALLVAGRIVDQDGSPLADARLDLCRRVEVWGNEHWLRYDCAGGHEVAADGSFSLWAIPGLELPKTSLHLRVRCRRYRPADLEVLFGQSGLRVVLQRGGALAGSVRLAPGQKASEVAVMLKGEAGGWMAKVRADGSFELDGLPPGYVHLVASLRTASLAEPSGARVSVEKLWIAGGETNRDPRIQGIELPDDSLEVTLEITNESGDPIAGAAVDSSEGGRMRADADGVAGIRPRELPVDLEVHAFGYRTLQLTAVSEDRRVVLREGLWIRLVTDARTVGREPAYLLGFRMRALDEQGQRGPLIGDIPENLAYFDAVGEALLCMPGPGDYSLEPTLFVKHEDGAGRGIMLPRTAVRTITVLDTQEVQTLAVDISQEEVSAAVARGDESGGE